jgi:hypothetical protein
VEHLNREGAISAVTAALDLDRNRVEAYSILAKIYADGADWRF